MFVFSLLACTEDPTNLDTTPTDAPTWHQDIAPIVSVSCAGCHTEGAIAGLWPFGSYEQAMPYATLMASYVQQRIMPPFPADETTDCANPWGFQNDRRLTDDQIALFSDWAEAGAPEGDPAQAAPLEEPPVVELPRVDQELSLEAPFAVPPASEVTDTLVCLVLDPGNDTSRWLEGVALAPDDRSVVHHAVVYVDAAAASDALAGPEGWYECFGGPGVESSMIAAFAPGSPPMLTPEGSGIPVPAGARIVVQMHYHGVSTERFDRSTLQLAWSASQPQRTAYTALYGNATSAEEGLEAGPSDRSAPEFRIPAGAAGHTERMHFPVVAEAGVDYGVFLVANHMHLLGKRMRAWIEPKEGGPSKCLLDTPRYDYDWQLSYTYDINNSPTLQDGDTLVIECTYDNTEDNPGVQRMLDETGLTAPIDVGVGEETLDEMCIFLGGVVPLDR